MGKDNWWCPYHGYATPASMTTGSGEQHCGYPVSPGSGLCIARVYDLEVGELDGLMRLWKPYLEKGSLRPEPSGVVLPPEPDLEAIVQEEIVAARMESALAEKAEQRLRESVIPSFRVGDKVRMKDWPYTAPYTVTDVREHASYGQQVLLDGRLPFIDASSMEHHPGGSVST